jgi:hypothetical protein
LEIQTPSVEASRIQGGGDPLVQCRAYFHLNESDKAAPFSEWSFNRFFFEAVNGDFTEEH